MKKLGKAAVCILIAALAILNLVAKYQTHGLYLFKPVSKTVLQDAANDAKSELMSDAPVHVFKTSFGKAAVVIISYRQSLLDIFHRHDHNDNCPICASPPVVVSYVQTATPGIVATHFDFLGLAGCPKPLTQVIQKAGMPTVTDGSYRFRTLDGYFYQLWSPGSGLAGIQAIYAPDGTVLFGAEIPPFLWKIRAVYLAAASLLSIALFFILRLHRKLQDDIAPPRHIPSRKKVIVITVCVLILLSYGFRTISNFDYNGLAADFYFRYPIPYTIVEPDYNNHRQNGIHINHFGKTVVFIRYRSESDLYHIPLGTYYPAPRTHLTLLTIHKGMTVPKVYSILGMPDEFKGPADTRKLVYVTPSGYTYEIRTEGEDYVGFRTVKNWKITAPDGKILEASSFQWQVRLIYLGIAAGLSAFATALILISNHIRKRKAAT